jgi:hypothetical protein
VPFFYEASGQGENGEPPGFSLLEALVSLLLLCLVCNGAWLVFAKHRTAALRVAEVAEGLETVRIVGWVLSEELHGSRAGLDWWGEAGDSIGLRAFRGLGIVTDADGPSEELLVCYRGLRQPDPAKDSILFLDGRGRWRAAALAGRSAGSEPCAEHPGSTEERWQVSPRPTTLPLLARVFESGVYSFTDDAFRYRRGLGGRQPITPERLDEGVFLPASGPVPSLTWAVRLTRSGTGSETFRWEGAVW